MKQQIYIDRNFGWFIGVFDNNQKHRHYAIQLSIPLENTITLKTSEKTITTEYPVLIRANVIHQIVSTSQQFLLLINPASAIGHFWQNSITNEIQEFNHSPATDLKKMLTNSGRLSMLTKELNEMILRYNCFCSAAIHQGDERINHALLYLDKNFDKVVTLEEIANHCHLSPGRFLHLFKEQVGITFRRAQLWNKVVKSLQFLGKQSFTTIAHEVGFSDSAHLSRIFKENFGFSPRDFLKLSQFIQV